jgi:hypothetical protein
VLTAELACEEVLGSEADWHPETRTRTPRSRSESSCFMMMKKAVALETKELVEG